jgi:phage terminase large subunit
MGNGKTRLETLIALGRNPVLVPDHKVEDGINAAYLMFKRVWFDEARCAPGLEALRQHRVDYDEKTRSFKKDGKGRLDLRCGRRLPVRRHGMAGDSKGPGTAAEADLTPTQELTIAEWERYGSSRNPDRA